MELKIKMISAASHTISYIKNNTLATEEEVFNNILKSISREIKNLDEKTNRAIIASISKAYKIAKENPYFSEKELLRKFMEEIPFIIEDLERED